MQPPASENWTSILNAAGVLVGGAIVGAAMWMKSYWTGRAEAPEDVHGKHVILEQAELRDFGILPQEMRAITAKLDQTLQLSQSSGTTVAENGRKIEELLRILRRMEGELDLAKRMREEEILRVRQREG